MKVLLILFLPVLTFAKYATVRTPSGTVIGSTIYFKKKPVDAFLGIPYAEPPIGDLRFRKTVPIQPWSAPKVALEFSPACVQYYPINYDWVDKMDGQSEDCLYLNIWVPDNNLTTTSGRRNPKAMMFFVHGGAYSLGSSRLKLYDGYVLAAEGDVIVVTFNYRLSILGFLSTDSEEAPGNMGLYDVVEALKWINNNIEAFGGDKGRITVFGQSVGGVTVGYLAVSPLAKGLFQRGILESGSPLIMNGDSKKKNFELGQKVAKAVECASDSMTIQDEPEEVVKCLRSVTPNILLYVVNHFNPRKSKSFSSITGDDFLPEEPKNAILNGDFQDIDILAGVVKDEGSIKLIEEYEMCGPFGKEDPKINKTKGADLIRKMFEEFEFKEDVVNHYLYDLDEYDYDTVRSQVYHSRGDFQIVCPTLYFLENVSKRIKAYFYYYDHRTSLTAFAPWTGVLHISEVAFVFGRPLDSPDQYTREEAKLSRIVIDAFTSFAKYGNPSSAWDMFTDIDFYIQETGHGSKVNGNYLQQHLSNCEFFRPYFGY